MYGFGPISFYPISVVTVPDPPWLWFTESYVGKGLTQQTSEPGERWETIPVGFTLSRIGESYSTGGLVFSTLDFVERWLSSGIGGEIVFGSSWQTRIPDVQERVTNESYSIKGATLRQSSFWGRWATEGAPINLTTFVEEWSTSAPVRVALSAWESWVSIGVELSVLGVEEQWPTFIPELSALTLEERWYFNYMVRRAWTLKYPTGIRKSWSIPYQIGTTRVRRAWALPSPMLTQVRRAWELPYAIRNVDQVIRGWRLPSTILNGAVIIQPDVPVLAVGNRLINLDNVEIATDEGDFGWTCSFELRDPLDYTLFGLDTPFTVTLGSEVYHFICNEPGFNRSGQVSLSAKITGISPSAQYGDVRATLVTKTWESATLVSEILDEVFGPGVVEMRIADWLIPAGRLAVDFASPVSIARSIAEATGALLESEINGDLFIRYKFPVPVPLFGITEPDQTYDDVRDEFTLDERFSYQRIENLFRILDSSDDQSGLLLIEVDGREDGRNKGRTRFMPGEQPYLLVYKGEDVTVTLTDSSAGAIIDVVDEETAEEEEELDFANVTEADTRYPIESIVEYKWLGNDLGTPTIDGSKKVVITEPGIGVLKIKYVTKFSVKQLVNVPNVLNGETEYGVLAVTEGSQQ